MHLDLRYRHTLRRGADDVILTMVCYFLSPWQLEVKESRYFTGTFDHLSGTWLSPLGKTLRQRKQSYFENSSDGKDHYNNTKH